MTMPPTYNLHELGPQAQMLSRNCTSERLAMILQYVAVGSMIVMAGVALSHAAREALRSRDSGQGWSR